MIRFEATYTEAMVAKAARTFLTRRVPLRSLSVLVVIVLVSAGLLLWRGDRGWIVGVLVSVPLVCGLMAAAVWRAQLLQSRARLRRMNPKTVDISLGPDGLSFSSSLGHAEVPWRIVTEVWVCPGFWMVFTAPNSYNIVPTAPIPAAAWALARANVSVL